MKQVQGKAAVQPVALERQGENKAPQEEPDEAGAEGGGRGREVHHPEDGKQGERKQAGRSEGHGPADPPP